MALFAVSWVVLQCMTIVWHFLVILPYFSRDYEKLIFDFGFCSLYISPCMLGIFFIVSFASADFFQNYFQEHYQNVK